MDEPQESLPVSRWSLALARVVAQGSLLAGIFGVLVALVLFGELSLVAALVSFLVIMAGAAMLPGGTITVAPTADLARPTGAEGGDAVFAFADALADPCLVLDRRSVVLHANAAARYKSRLTVQANQVGK